MEITVARQIVSAIFSQAKYGANSHSKIAQQAQDITSKRSCNQT
jgi:hypothetical protein